MDKKPKIKYRKKPEIVCTCCEALTKWACNCHGPRDDNGQCDIHRPPTRRGSR